MSLNEVLDERLGDLYNSQLIGNLALVAEAVQERPLTFSSWHVNNALVGQQRSARPAGKWKGVQVDRAIECLLDAYSLNKSDLVEFAAGGVVLDVGSGRSNFLDAFQLDSRTIAVDLHEPYVRYQESHWHEALQLPADNLSGIKTGSVRLLHATFSSPFWAVTPEEAAATAHEYRRVLEIGGIALVGPLITKEDHEHCEQLVRSKRDDGRPMLPWGEEDMDPYYAHVRTAFVQAVLANGMLLKVIGERYIGLNHGIDWFRSDYEVHVPNFLIMKRNDCLIESGGSQGPGPA